MMTQADQNTPEENKSPTTATISKRVTKPKTAAAKAAADTEVLAPVKPEQSPSLDAAVNQEKTSSQAELQGMQSDTVGQNLIADVEPEHATTKEVDVVNQMFLSVNMEGMPEAQREAYKRELEGMLSDTAGQNPVVDVEPEQTTDKEADAIKSDSDSEPENDNLEVSVMANTESISAEILASPVNEPIGTEQVLFLDQSAQYQSAAAAVQVAEKSAEALPEEASSVELINEVLPDVQRPSPVKYAKAVKSGLSVVVKNTGVQTVFEPLSKTSIKSGETAEIRCSNGQFKYDVLNNLKQFIGLGKNLEIQNA